MLQIFDAGRLTDSQGHTVDFRNTVIIMTSNIAADRLAVLGGSPEDRLNMIYPELRKHFRPEFLNRIDEIVVFNPLNLDNIKEIVELQLKPLVENLKEKDIEFEITESAKELLALQGYDSQYGARPLRRTIQRLVETPLARMIISGELKPGDTVLVDEKDGKLNFSVKEKVSASTNPQNESNAK